jgi:alpha-glucosidase
MCPFVSGDNQVFRELYEKHDAFLHDPNNPGAALMIKWWNGHSALLDFTHPPAETWFRSELDRLQSDYGIDGFKLDAGDFNFYHWAVPHKKNTGFAEQGELYARIGLDYPLNEYRACFKLGGEPLAQRLHDKNFNWEDLRKLVPSMTLLGLMGYPFACPDMIGGGEYRSFLALEKLDQELIVRSAQVHALMPMMQFSVAPWRVLDATHLAAAKEAALLHQQFGPKILKLAKAASVSGEPIVKSMEYAYPEGDYALIHDQFLLGDDYLVAPVLESGVREREVILPAGKWKYIPTGEVFTGPGKVVVEVPLEVLAYFRKM